MSVGSEDRGRDKGDAPLEGGIVRWKMCCVGQINQSQWMESRRRIPAKLNKEQFLPVTKDLSQSELLVLSHLVWGSR
jgi:hypothetical protein